MNIIFKDNDHKRFYEEYRNRLNSGNDNYKTAVAYLFALDEIVRKHIDEIIVEDGLDSDCICREWNTGTSKKVLRLAFNLWNGKNTDRWNDVPSMLYTPEQLFCCEYAPYFCEALKIRFDWYFRSTDR